MVEKCLYMVGTLCIIILVVYFFWYIHIRSNLIENISFDNIIDGLNRTGISFDDVMNNECERISRKARPNYLGHWDNTYNGKCAEYECPLETCYHLENDPTFPKVGGKTWRSNTTPQDYDVDTKTCVSKHNRQTKEFCDASESKQYQNNENHFEKKLCYIHTENNVDEIAFYNVLHGIDENGSNSYVWSNQDGDIYDESTCKETKLDCSACNYYCCEYNPQRRCDGTPNTLTSDDIDMKVVFKYDSNPDNHSCVKDTINSVNCFGSGCDAQPHGKDCWQFDSYNLIWRNDIYTKRTQPNGECVYFNSKGDIFDEALYADPDAVCLSNLNGKRTNEDCNKFSNVDCDYIDVNEQYQTVTYEPTLNYAGTTCVWKTLDKRHFVQPGSLVDVNGANYSSLTTEMTPEILTTPSCPPLTPRSCKNSNNEYLHKYPIDSKTAHECVTCPAGMYRNSNMDELLVAPVNEAEFCTPKIDEDCSESQVTCIKKLDDDSETSRVYIEVNIPSKRNDKLNPNNIHYGKGNLCVLDNEWAANNCERQQITNVE